MLKRMRWCTGSAYLLKRRAAHQGWAARFATGRRLAGALIRPAASDLVDREVRSAAHVAGALVVPVVPLEERHGETEQRLGLAELDLCDGRADGGPVRGAVARLARRLDGGRVNHRRGVRRKPEELLVPMVCLRERGHCRVREVHRET